MVIKKILNVLSILLLFFDYGCKSKDSNKIKDNIWKINIAIIKNKSDDNHLKSKIKISCKISDSNFRFYNTADSIRICQMYQDIDTPKVFFFIGDYSRDFHYPCTKISKIIEYDSNTIIETIIKIINNRNKNTVIIINHPSSYGNTNTTKKTSNDNIRNGGSSINDNTSNSGNNGKNGNNNSKGNDRADTTSKKQYLNPPYNILIDSIFYWPIVNRASGYKLCVKKFYANNILSNDTILITGSEHNSYKINNIKAYEKFKGSIMIYTIDNNKLSQLGKEIYFVYCIASKKLIEIEPFK